MMTGEEAMMTGEEATKLGYRRTSNKYRMVSRIDKPDWVDRLAKSLHVAKADLYIPGTNKVSGNWCCYYRRILSKDTIVLPQEEFRKVPSSDHDPCGYVGKEPAYGDSLEDICRAHFNEPMLVGRNVVRCIGYGEDEHDAYIIAQGCGGRIIWATGVGGYYFLDRLKGQEYVRSTSGEDWDDFTRLDSTLALNGAPKAAEFKVEKSREL